MVRTTLKSSEREIWHYVTRLESFDFVEALHRSRLACPSPTYRIAQSKSGEWRTLWQPPRRVQSGVIRRFVRPITVRTKNVLRATRERFCKPLFSMQATSSLDRTTRQPRWSSGGVKMAVKTSRGPFGLRLQFLAPATPSRCTLGEEPSLEVARWRRRL